MSEERKRTDVTSADTKSIGFEYQYLYFICKLFSLTKGEEVGYEDLDDVHKISLCSSTTYLYQLKHTNALSTNGEQINLPLLSEDLWKTLSNWALLISDPVEGRIKLKDELKFIETSTFIFVTNRKIDKNTFVQLITTYRNGNENIVDLIQQIKDIKDSTKSDEIKGYINNILKLNNRVIDKFMKNLFFVNSDNNLFNVIRDGIRDKMVPEEYVEDVLANLYLQLKEEFFDKIAMGEHQVITYSQWITKYGSVFNEPRKTLLPIRTFQPELPNELEKQEFVKELIDIGELDMKADGYQEVLKLTTNLINLENNITAWEDEGRLSLKDIKNFDSDTKSYWRNIHKESHRSSKKNNDKDYTNAIQCFDRIMEHDLNIYITPIGTNLSNGQFIKLAERKQIGWIYNWKEKYYED